MARLYTSFVDVVLGFLKSEHAGTDIAHLRPSLVLYYVALYAIRPTPVAARSKAWVCGRSLAGIADSNPARGMDVCLLCVLCVVR
jgi:hypothetical protein